MFKNTENRTRQDRPLPIKRSVILIARLAPIIALAFFACSCSSLGKTEQVKITFWHTDYSDDDNTVRDTVWGIRGNLPVGAGDLVTGLDIGIAGYQKKVTGLAIAGYRELADEITGLAIAGYHAGANEITGLVIAGYKAGAKEMTGLAIAGGVAGGIDKMTGLAIAGVGAGVTNEMTGIAIAGGWAGAKEMTGILISPVSTSAKKTTGLQIGGLFNKCYELHGIQIGLINYAKNGFVPWFPLFNFSFGDDAE